MVTWKGKQARLHCDGASCWHIEVRVDSQIDCKYVYKSTPKLSEPKAITVRRKHRAPTHAKA